MTERVWNERTRLDDTKSAALHPRPTRSLPRRVASAFRSDCTRLHHVVLVTSFKKTVISTFRHASRSRLLYVRAIFRSCGRGDPGFCQYHRHQHHHSFLERLSTAQHHVFLHITYFFAFYTQLLFVHLLKSFQSFTVVDCVAHHSW